MRRLFQFLHHTPGRLRVEVHGLKGNRVLADAISREAAAVEGIQRVQVSTLTGTVVLHYSCKDPAALARLHSLAGRAEAMLNALAANRSAGPASPHASQAESGEKGMQ